MTDRASLSVVICAYRSSATLGACVAAALKSGDVLDVVVVDNSSDLASRTIAETFGPRVVYLDPGTNVGFARGCNLGVAATQGEVLVFLNPDVRLTRDLHDLVGLVRTHGAAAAAGRLDTGLAGVVANARRRVTAVTELAKACRGSSATLTNIAPDSGVHSVPQVDGALLVVERSTFDDVGTFDESFELYYEDVELCDRLRSRGPILIDTREFGVHAGGASARQATKAAYCAHRVSRVRYLRRASPFGHLAIAPLLALVEFLARTIAFTYEGVGTRLRSVGQQLTELLRPQSVRVLPPN